MCSIKQSHPSSICVSRTCSRPQRSFAFLESSEVVSRSDCPLFKRLLPIAQDLTIAYCAPFWKPMSTLLLFPLFGFLIPCWTPCSTISYKGIPWLLSAWQRIDRPRARWDSEAGKWHHIAPNCIKWHDEMWEVAWWCMTMIDKTICLGSHTGVILMF